ncbi:MAG TPA: hypothetical protein VF158_03120 [Longimicrobiales bacterium]
MPSVRDFFVAEAGECLLRLGRLVEAAASDGVNAAELLRLTRLLRGSAQMAREKYVASVAGALEAAAHSIARGEIAWDDGARARVLDTLADLRALIDPGESVTAREARVSRALERWRRSDAAAPAAPARPAPPRPTVAETEAFHDYAAREVAGVLSELDRNVPILEREPRNREPLKAVLRRQRALLGSARLDELPAVADALRTIDQICRLIARQDVAVEGEWLDLFRLARRVLGESVEALVAGSVPDATPSQPALGRIRETLLERYGIFHDPPRPQVLPGVEPPRNVVEFFRHEARILIGRIERMAGDLARASADRQAVLRRELQGALTALRDTALGFGFGRSARMADTALARVGGSTASEVLDLLPSLRETIETDEPVSVAAARGDAPEPGDAAGARDGAGAPGAAGTEGERPRAALLRRAEALRPAIERAVARDAEARAALAELFDLIRQGLA